MQPPFIKGCLCKLDHSSNVFSKNIFCKITAPIVLAYYCFISHCSIVCLCAYTEPVAVSALEHPPHARASPIVDVPSIVSMCSVQTQLSTSPPWFLASKLVLVEVSFGQHVWRSLYFCLYRTSQFASTYKSPTKPFNITRMLKKAAVTSTCSYHDVNVSYDNLLHVPRGICYPLLLSVWQVFMQPLS